MITCTRKEGKRLVVVMAVIRGTVVVQAACVFGIVVLVDGLTPFFFRKQLFDLPSVRLDSDREFQVFCGDRVPELECVSML